MDRSAIECTYMYIDKKKSECDKAVPCCSSVSELITSDDKEGLNLKMIQIMNDGRTFIFSSLLQRGWGWITLNALEKLKKNTTTNNNNNITLHFPKANLNEYNWCKNIADCTINISFGYECKFILVYRITNFIIRMDQQTSFKCFPLPKT